MMKRMCEGQFEVLDSFVIRSRNEFYVLGHITTGTVKEQWFIQLPLSEQLSRAFMICSVKEVTPSSTRNEANYTLLMGKGDVETLDQFIQLCAGADMLKITMGASEQSQ